MHEIKIQNDPIKFENTDKESVVWKWITRFGGLLGIVVTFTALFQIFYSEPKITVQQVSFTRDGRRSLVFPNFLSKDSTRINGIKYLMKISLNVADKDLNYKDIIVDLEFENGLTRTGKHFYPNSHFNIWHYGGKAWKLNVPQEKLFRYQTSLQKT